MIPSFSISKTPFFHSLVCFFILISSTTTKVSSDPFSYDCPNTTTYTPNSTYKTNLNTLFSVLSSNSTTSINGFSNFTAGLNPPDIAYGLFLCRGDASTNVCHDCVSTATKEAVHWCPNQKTATIWYDHCLLRFSDHRSIFSHVDLSVIVSGFNPQNVAEPNRFEQVLGSVMNDVATRASERSQSGKKFFATGQANLSSSQIVYGLAQCTPDVDSGGCNVCLIDGISNLDSCCRGKEGARVMYPSCIVWYELYPFYNATATATTTPPSPVPPPPLDRTSGKSGISLPVLIAIIVPIGVSVLLFIVCLCFLTRKTKKQYGAIEEDDVGNEITTVQFSQYDLDTIQAATNNFSDHNKIGQGGFGSVYKGILSTGLEIAVKRLSQNSRQGAEEFKNEVELVAKLQHRNLVRLLGFCLEGEEKILIYEFVPNKSLDYLLFDPQQEKLNWSKRYKIIEGIARGILYLHEDSQLRIIHRDLKPSNILLDGDMNAKISDFGLAKIFGVDQTQGNTNRITGTYGYMSPEYVAHGQFSAKSDVFSFGVIILEIISGKKNNRFYQSNCAEDLLSYAWKLWRDGTPLELMDPNLEGPYSRDEVTKCIHIGLLCVQKNTNARPSMATVVLMLSSCSFTRLVPQEPAFFIGSTMGSNTLKGLGSYQSTSKSMPSSVNEISISELDPR